MSVQITYVDVAKAAEQLRDEGRPIGPTKVRERLGRGSFTTVQKYLAEWENVQTELKAKAEGEKRAGPPEELFSELQNIMAAYWPHAVARAKEEMRPELEALNVRINDTILRNKEATVEIGNLENALGRASDKASQLEEAEKRASEANLRIIALQHELSRLEKIESRYEGQKELVATLQDQAKALKDQNSLLNNRAEELAIGLSQAQTEGSQKISALQAELSRLEKMEARSGSQLESLQEQKAGLTKKTQELAAELKEAQIKMAKLETKLEASSRKAS